ncbi:MAG TPA: SsrA-binding protein SmpB [Candidatus Moranbacteria bacterium]|nr:SsrA-binding protein SmpB [Candidatus Moranbacteria bacterium]
MTALTINKRAHFDYEIKETFEAGLALKGYEVKSIKTGHISLKESFVTIKGNELYLTNAHIPLYKQAGIVSNYDPAAPRKLLVKKSEIRQLIGKVRIQGLTLVPIKLYTKRRFIKLSFGLGKGKKEYDKRENIRKKDARRKIDRALKNF